MLRGLLCNGFRSVRISTALRSHPSAFQVNVRQAMTKTTSPVSFSFILRNGDEKQVQAEVGKNLLEVAHDNNIELEGACGGELACATCHLVFDPEIYDSLPKKLEEEDDMLDLAFGLTETSRLGCQIRVRDDFEGMKVRIPEDGF